MSSIPKRQDVRSYFEPKKENITPNVYYTEVERVQAARAYRDGKLPWPLGPLMEEGEKFLSSDAACGKISTQDLKVGGPKQKKEQLKRLFAPGLFYAGYHYALTEDRHTAIRIRDAVESILEVFMKLECSPREYIGIDYVGRGPQWGDTGMLHHMASLVWSIQASGVISSAFLNDFFGKFAREILEVNTLPILEYRTDKYHNVLTDVYGTAGLAAALLGERLKVRDLLDPRRSWTGPELEEYLWTGPKGLAYFTANAFNKGGTYWEMCYVSHCLHHIVPFLQLGRSRGRKLTPQLLNNLPAVLEHMVDEIFPNGEAPPVNEAHLGRHTCPSIVEPLAWLLGRRDIQRKLPLLDHLRRKSNNAQTSHWGKFLHRIFHPATRPGTFNGVFPVWKDHLHDESGQMMVRSADGNLGLHLNWDAYQDYHSDLDALSICLQHRGRFRVLDTGYQSGSPFRPWVRRTASHSTVAVDEESQMASQRFGHIETHVSNDDYTWIQVLAPQVYLQAKVYRRSLLILKREPFTVLDVFEVKGGWRHAFYLNGVGTPRLRTSRDGRRADVVWRDDDGTWLRSEAFSSGSMEAELQRIIPLEPYRKLALIRTGPPPLASIFVNVLTMGTGREKASQAKVGFVDGGLQIRLPATDRRKSVVLSLSPEKLPVLKFGSNARILPKRRGKPLQWSRTIRLQISKVLAKDTIETPCLACWPLEKGMTLNVRGRRYVLDSWRFSALPLRLFVERAAFEPRCILLRFKGKSSFRKSDVGATADLLPPVNLLHRPDYFI